MFPRSDKCYISVFYASKTNLLQKHQKLEFNNLHLSEQPQKIVCVCGGGGGGGGVLVCRKEINCYAFCKTHTLL